MFRLIGVIVVVAVIVLWYFDAFNVTQDSSGNVNVTIHKEKAEEAVQKSQEAIKKAAEETAKLAD
jgi:preprotein translocase subunit SecF